MFPGLALLLFKRVQFVFPPFVCQSSFCLVLDCPVGFCADVVPNGKHLSAFLSLFAQSAFHGLDVRSDWPTRKATQENKKC